MRCVPPARRLRHINASICPSSSAALAARKHYSAVGVEIAVFDAVFQRRAGFSAVSCHYRNITSGQATFSFASKIQCRPIVFNFSLTKPRVHHRSRKSPFALSRCVAARHPVLVKQDMNQSQRQRSAGQCLRRKPGVAEIFVVARSRRPSARIKRQHITTRITTSPRRGVEPGRTALR